MTDVTHTRAELAPMMRHQRAHRAALRWSAMMVAAASICAMLGQVSQAQPMPYLKQGQCSGSYVQSGSYCVPKSGGTVRPAVRRPPGASCPSGWTQSGGACERMRK